MEVDWGNIGVADFEACGKRIASTFKCPGLGLPYPTRCHRCIGCRWDTGWYDAMSNNTFQKLKAVAAEYKDRAAVKDTKRFDWIDLPGPRVLPVHEFYGKRNVPMASNAMWEQRQERNDALWWAERRREVSRLDHIDKRVREQERLERWEHPPRAPAPVLWRAPAAADDGPPRRGLYKLRTSHLGDPCPDLTLEYVREIETVFSPEHKVFIPTADTVRALDMNLNAEVSGAMEQDPALRYYVYVCYGMEVHVRKWRQKEAGRQRRHMEEQRRQLEAKHRMQQAAQAEQAEREREWERRQAEQARRWKRRQAEKAREWEQRQAEQAEKAREWEQRQAEQAEKAQWAARRREESAVW